MYKFGNNISWQVLDCNLYIIDERDSREFILNSITMKICLALIKGESISKIAKDIASEYFIDENWILGEIKKLIDDLLQASIFVEGNNE